MDGIAALVLAATVVEAQAAPTADSTRLARPLFVHSDLYILGGFGAATIAMFPLDRRLALAVRRERLITNRDLRRLSNTLDFLGGPGPFLIGSTMYVVGRVGRVPRAAELAVHGTEAVVVGIVTAGALKTVLGRARPYVSADTNPNNFGFFRGLKGSNYLSFPSGHSTTAFAAASAVSAETAEWWPKSKWIIGPILHGGAALVGLSRMYGDKHWASDVVMGAAVGIFAGQKTVRFNHSNEGNRVNRWLLGSGRNPVKLRMYPGDAGTVDVALGIEW